MIELKRYQTQYALRLPPRRPLQIFASDPMMGRAAGNRVRIDVATEPLTVGPAGERVVVIDYDSANERYYTPVDLNDSAVLMRGGLDPAESDPRFHQQMVYAVAMKTIENFDRALGRRLEFRQKNKSVVPLRILPHAFHGANAFFDPELVAVLFGYFRADSKDPGENLPGQNVFSCLSHDIIAHEVTHALVHRLRSHYLEPSNEDVRAFHEGFSDIVALFQHFSYSQILADQIQSTKANIGAPGPLADLARQFGYALGSGRALRSALDKPDRKLYDSVTEPHQRGAILVAAVFDGFVATYQRRIRDLIRIATGGTGVLTGGDLHPDLVGRIAREAADTAQKVLTMCIRAFEYLPPVDVNFGDYLCALITADYELVADDEYGLRAAMIEGFRRRGIFPAHVSSLAEESLIWPSGEGLPPLPAEVFEYLSQDARNFGRRATRRSAQVEGLDSTTPRETRVSDDLARKLHQYAVDNATELGLAPQPEFPIVVDGFHAVFRVAPSGELLTELVAQFTQVDQSFAERFGGLPLRGGCTLIASARDGAVRYVIGKPMPRKPGAPAPVTDKEKENATKAAARIERQARYVAACDRVDPMFAACDDKYLSQRMSARMNFASLHQGSV